MDVKFEFCETSADKILNILKGLNPFKVAYIDSLIGKFLKDVVEILATPVSQICNLSVKINSLPRETIKVKPLLEKGSNTDPQIYHPISQLPIFSKIIERINHDQTQ